MAIIDCAAMIEPHWKWDSFPFVSQTYHQGDEFQEFGLKWYGTGFSYITSPAWRIPGARRLDDYPLRAFVGVATVLDFSGARRISRKAVEERLQDRVKRRILVLKTGHADRISRRDPDYWERAPRVQPGIAELLKARGVVHLAVDLPCDHIEEGELEDGRHFKNPNEELRRQLHALGLLLTENCENLTGIHQDEVFFASLPLALPRATTGPTRPVAATYWHSARPVLHDVSTPLFNHWRWRFNVFEGRSFENGDRCEEQHFVFRGHGFTHCDAPCHMSRDGPGIHELPNRGLDMFVGNGCVVDFSDLKLPQPITLRLMERRGAHIRRGDLVILRSDLNGKLGYESRDWHLHAPHLEEGAARWLADRRPSAVCLDFPQDFVAREMPTRHVRNEEFVAHHALFRAHIPFVEDLQNLGAISVERPFVMAIPLKTVCPDGAPMRVVTVEW